MSDTPYMKLFVGDLMADTMELDNREFGAYMRIIFAMWQSKTGLIHMRKMKLVSRCGRDWGAVWREIMHFFDISDDQFVSQKRVIIERDKAALISSVRRTSGGRGNDAKALKRCKSVVANADANATKARAYIKDHNHESLTDTSYLPDSMPGCSASASQPPPTSAEAGAAPPAPARDAPARDAPASAPPPVRDAPASARGRSRESPADVDAAQIAMAVAVFNKLAANVGWPAVKPPLSAARAAKLRARIKRAGGIAEWMAQLRRAAASDFLTGKSESGWKASFDFLAQESSFDRLIEGNYDNSTRKPTRPTHDRGPEGARGADRPAGSRHQRDGSGPHRGLLAGFAQASQRLDADPNDARNGGDDPALG